MDSRFRAARLLLAGFALLLGAAASLPAFGETPGLEPDFELRDFLGRSWNRESVRFALSEAQWKSARSGRMLAAEGAGQVPYQLVAPSADEPASIELLTDLAAFERKRFWFTRSRALTESDLRVTDATGAIRMENDRAGIELRKHLQPGEGPIARIRLASGAWVGDSVLRTGTPVAAYSVEVTARGPVFAEVRVLFTFAERPPWEMRIRLQAGEPVILVDESFALGDESLATLVVDRGFAAATLLYRTASGPATGRVATARLEPGADLQFTLEPWLHWGRKEKQGNWFALFGDASNDLLAIGARAPGIWIDPDMPPRSRSAIQLPLVRHAGELGLELPLRGGARKWMIMALDRDETLKPFRARMESVAPLPQQYLIKHGDFPLGLVNSYVLSWRGEETIHRRLMVTEQQLAHLRQSFKPDPVVLARLRRTPVTRYSLDDHLLYYLATGDSALQAVLAEAAARWVQDAVDMLVRQDSLVTLGFAPHHQTSILTAANLAGAMWESPSITDAMRSRMKAQLAFLAHTVNRTDYWSPERGYAANPNMTTTVATYQTVLASMIATHPLAPAWIDRGMRTLKDEQLDGWSDADGGWLEAPHYALVSYDHMLGAFIAARNAGFEDHVFDPKMKKIGEWLARISTPRDDRSLGNRHLPPIGNTYMREPTGIFGTLACLWKDVDPEFAANMQWMHREHGSPTAPGIGGFFATLAGYRKILADESLPAKAPHYESERFDRTGVVLRSGFPSTRESQLHLIAGGNHDHYDFDSGSFTLWGQGRLVANDFGYYGRAPATDHNMVVVDGASPDGVMRVAKFTRGDDADYVRASKDDGWTRRIVFVKAREAGEPSFFVLNDSVAQGRPATWRVWFSAREIRPAAQGAAVIGEEDVDSDVVFPPGTTSSTEEMTRESPGLTAGRYETVATTQKGLIVRFANAPGLTTLIHPRLKREKPATVISIAGGRGVRMESAAGIDYVFASPEPFEFADDSIMFSGTVGLARLRGKRSRLWLGEPGRVKAPGASLDSPQP